MNPSLTDDILILTVKTLASCSYNISETARTLGVGRSTVNNRIEIAKRKGLYKIEPKKIFPGIEEIKPNFDFEATLKRGFFSIDALRELSGYPRDEILEKITTLSDKGLNVRESCGEYTISRIVPTSRDDGNTFEYKSRKDNTYVFGAIGDSHLCSKYARLDVLNSLYDAFEKAGVDRVFHTGNYVDGETNFNRYDILVHGIDGQMRYLAENYPKKKGIKTYVVSGDDHEGWWAQREGINVGKYAENIMREAGRDDWVDCGYMEASFILRNANSGKTGSLLSMHPGGGSAYATSYTVQKIVESLEGGEKPDILLAGHYHKCETNLVRNVYTVQTGSQQDQTPFMRKKKIDSQIGGYIIEAEQDPATGAIIRCKCDLLRFFNRGYYEDRNNRWSHSGDVVLPKRKLGR